MTSTTLLAPQADPQAEVDEREIALEYVGVSNVLYPVRISGWETRYTEQIKDAVFTLKVSLEANRRGIHMSRLLEGLHHWQDSLCPETLPAFLKQMRKSQGAAEAYLSCAFTWFVKRPTPKTGLPAWQGIETTWHGRQDSEGSCIGYTLRIPVTTLCPCSLEISDYGAHSQRGWVKVKIEWDDGASVVAPEEICLLYTSDAADE